MQITVRIKGLPGASQLRRIVMQKLYGALANYAHAIVEASVRLHDINGPDRGGVDKLCMVMLKMKDCSVLVIEELGADILQVINRAADRSQRNVAYQLA